MSTVLVVGDGPLAAEVADLAAAAGHDVVSFFNYAQDIRVEPEIELRLFLSGLNTVPEVAVEAVLADRGDKWSTVHELDTCLPPGALLLTATLNASATEVAGWVDRSDRVVGWAGLPPLEEATVIELVPAIQSDPESVEQARTWWQSAGKEPVPIADTVGGVWPRIVVNVINEAAFALGDRIASAEDIDLAMRLGTNYPRGPLAWGDLIGLDQVMGILEALGEAYGPDVYRPAPLLRQLVHAGLVGQLAGRGFYTYGEEETDHGTP
ncbi:MAG: 3-hydroxyacyl-CoA dehydrogenase family protein [Ardenticatenia bacterium]|nr:3-hydroxyacyl-CoA dehydrogenase family protein [Ardenticatenia bacterium]